MQAQIETPKKNKKQSVAKKVTQKQSDDESLSYYMDNRAEAIVQRKLQETMNSSSQLKQPAQLQAVTDNYSTQRKEINSKDSVIQRFYAVKDNQNSKDHPNASTGEVDSIAGMQWINLPDPRDVSQYPVTVADTNWWFRNLYKRSASSVEKIIPKKETEKKKEEPTKPVELELKGNTTLIKGIKKEVVVEKEILSEDNYKKKLEKRVQKYIESDEKFDILWAEVKKLYDVKITNKDLYSYCDEVKSKIVPLSVEKEKVSIDDKLKKDTKKKYVTDG